MRRIQYRVFGLLFMIAGALQASAETVKVGVALRFAPERNSFAADMYQGIELAAQEFNARENEPTRIELVKYSHKDSHDSVDEASEKILKDKIQYVIGGEMSDDAFAMAEAFQGKSVLLMTPTASNPLLTAGRPYVFRTCFSDDRVAELFAKYVAGLKNVQSIGVLHNTSNAYSDYLTNAFLDQFEKLQKAGKAVQITEFRYASEQPSFESAVEQFKRAKVDFVIAFTLQESIKTFQAAAQRAKFDPEYLGSDGWGPTESLLAVPGFHGIRYDHWNNTSKAPAVLRFKREFEKAYNHVPNSSNASSFDAAIVLFEAIAKAKKKNDVAEVANALQTGEFKNGVTAPVIRFGRSNAPKKSLYLYEIKGGKAQYLKEVD